MNKRGVRVLPVPADLPRSIDKFKNLPKLPLVKAREYGVWHVDCAELEAKVLGTRVNKAGGLNGGEKRKELLEKKELAERLVAQYSQDYESSKGRDGETKMLLKTQRSGTAADKVAAFRVTFEDNPIANMRSLDALLGMVTSKVGKRHAQNGFETLKELFLSVLPDRKLKSLFQRPIELLPESRDGNSLLLFWHWEDCLKERYERFIFALEEASKDVLPVLKDKAIKVLYALLKCKPEQERKLLSALVNKLGDPENKAASSADFLLTNLLSEHPNMKAVVIGEVDSFLFRPHLGLQAKYYAVNFLSKFRLSSKGDGPKVAKRLIDVYFAVFKELISLADGERKTDKSHKAVNGGALSSFNKKKTESSAEHLAKESRILSAVLTGVNRAFPFVSNNEVDDLIEVQTPMLFQLVHSKNFNVGVQALMLLDKISSKNQIVSDRYFRALYSKLLLPAALNSSKAEMFFGLLLRAMKGDVNFKRVCSFSKRLLQVALLQPPQYACGCLLLLSEVLKARPSLWSMLPQNEAAADDREHFKDIADDDANESNTTSMKQENAIAVVNSNDNFKTDSGSSEAEDDSSEVTSNPSEDDVSDEAEEDFMVGNDSNSLQESRTVSKHDRQRPLESAVGSFLPGGYNPRHREPSHCNADRVSWWELKVLALHVHPSVQEMAKALLAETYIIYNGNPLNNLSLTAFLDKFMEKKPKTITWHGGSQIEPAKKLDMNDGHLIGEEIVSLAEADVAPEDLVFHKFYMNKMSSSKKPKKKKKKKAVEEEAAAEEMYGVDGGDESDNDEIENMLDSANDLLEADGEYDYDDLDQVANEDDDDLIDASDAEMDILPDIAGEDGEEDAEEDNGHGGIDVGDVDDDGNGGEFNKSKRKRKSRGKKGASSPFASVEEFEHLLNEDDDPEPEKSKTKSKSTKKRRSSR